MTARELRQAARKVIADAFKGKAVNNEALGAALHVLDLPIHDLTEQDK